MADSTVHALTDGTAPAATDEFYIARTPYGTGDDRKLTWAAVLAAAQAGLQPLDADLTVIAALDSTGSGVVASDGAGWFRKSYAALKAALGLTSADVGLGNVTNAAQLTVSQLDTDGTLAAISDARVPSQKAVKTYADQLIAAADAMVFKGVIDCSANPNYPAADAGWTYRVSVAGKIGGGAGTNVEVGDLLMCTVDGTGSGTQAGVGANWTIAQANLDGAVIGPASAVSLNLVQFSGTTGKLVADSGISVDTDGTLAANSDTRLATQKAVRTYVAANAGGSSGVGTYGDGSDGTVTFDGAATILGMAPAANVYTLTRDVFFAACTVNNGVTIITNGFRIFCVGTLTNNGTIQWNGNNASGTNQKTGGASTSNVNGSISALTAAQSAPGGTGATGVVGAGVTPAVSISYTFGGIGGGGGGSGSGAGSSGGGLLTATTVLAPRTVVIAVLGFSFSAGTPVLLRGGTGGGSGAGDGGTNAGGGGGSGGGIVVIVAKTIAGTGTIQAKGGNGGTPTTSVGGCGGGGGGGGGLIIIVSQSISGGAIAGQTISVAGGTGGTQTGGGANGANGATGGAILVAN